MTGPARSPTPAQADSPDGSYRMQLSTDTNEGLCPITHSLTLWRKDQKILFLNADYALPLAFPCMHMSRPSTQYSASGGSNNLPCDLLGHSTSQSSLWPLWPFAAEPSCPYIEMGSTLPSSSKERMVIGYAQGLLCLKRWWQPCRPFSSKTAAACTGSESPD